MPQSSKKTRERQLAKLAARRAAERKRRRRTRAIALGVGGLAAAGVLVALFLVFLGGGKKPVAASKRIPTPTPSVSPTATATAQAVACNGTVPAASKRQSRVFTKAPTQTIHTRRTYTATMQTSCGTIVIRLDQEDAPHTVNSLVFLIDHHFYDGLTFH